MATKLRQYNNNKNKKPEEQKCGRRHIWNVQEDRNIGRKMWGRSEQRNEHENMNKNIAINLQEKLNVYELQ